MNKFHLYKVGKFRPFYFIIFLFLLSCKNDSVSEKRFDYYSSKIEIKYAKGFDVSYFKSYKVLDVFNNLDTNEVFKRYFLVEQGTKIPEMAEDDVLIRVPLASVSCLSTTQVAYLSVLGVVNNISGVGYASSIKDSIINSQLEHGWTMEITRSGQLDKELVLQSNTTTLMVNAFDVLSVSSYGELGIPVIFSTEYMENNALARAEWIKYFSLFFNAEKKATVFFNNLEQNYIEVKEELSGIEERPEVMFGSYYQGSYYVPGGESLIPNLFMDAGAKYAYDDQKTRQNIHIDSESLMDRMMQIEQWGFVLSKEGQPIPSDFLGGDSRMLDVAKKQDMQFFYCNTFYCDYFGMANLEPDIVLKDLSKIFHPSLFPEHQFVYFQSFK